MYNFAACLQLFWENDVVFIIAEWRLVCFLGGRRVGSFKDAKFKIQFINVAPNHGVQSRPLTATPSLCDVM